jgi:hypothetical protein
MLYLDASEYLMCGCKTLNFHLSTRLLQQPIVALKQPENNKWKLRNKKEKIPKPLYKLQEEFKFEYVY